MFENSRKVIAKTVVAMTRKGDTPVDGIVKYCRDKCGIDVSKGKGIQGALELIRVLNAIMDKTIDATETEFDAIPWTASQKLSPYLDPKSTDYKYKDNALAAWKSLEPSKAFKALKDKIDADTLAANQPTIAAAPDPIAAPASDDNATVAIAIESAPVPPTTPPIAQVSNDDAIAALAAFINESTDLDAIEKIGTQLATMLQVAEQRINAIIETQNQSAAA
jgi:hypothetical protein